MNSLAKLLKQERKLKGLSQLEVSKRMGFTSNGYIADMEKGRYLEPEESTLQRYAKALDITWERMQFIQRKAKLMDMGIKEENIFTDMVRIPILGEVPCGNPQESIQETEDFLPLPIDDNLLKRRDIFGLRANGLSMKDAGILPGDIIIVDPYAQVNNGDIVVATIDGEATLKFFYERGGYVELRPANPDFRPIEVNDPSFKVVGKVIKKITIEDYE
jgi:SOS regulatory protein LexA